MKAYIEVLKLNVQDVITTSGGCGNADPVTGIDGTFGSDCTCEND